MGMKKTIRLIGGVIALVLLSGFALFVIGAAGAVITGSYNSVLSYWLR